MGVINDATMLPIGLAASLGMAVVSFVRTLDRKDAGHDAEVALLKLQVARLEQRADKSDERWDRVLEKLSEIQTRLGVVEVRPKD
jgi:hypothetical protein